MAPLSLANHHPMMFPDRGSPEFAQFEEHTFVNKEVKLHAVAAGPKDGPLAILLHGFPEFWYCWRKQIAPLAAAGLRVIVPDQRGYNLSSKPGRVRDYALPCMTSDVIAIADHLSREKFSLAGHDWGAAVAWNTAIHFASRVSRLAILNVPHPSVMRRYFLRPAQLLKSWYMFFFQLPVLPEALFSMGNFRLGIDSLRRTSRSGTFTSEDLQRYREAWSQPGAVSAMIHWYRALFRHWPQVPSAKLSVPTLVLWGVEDRFLLPRMADESAQQCTDVRLVRFEHATHWLPHEEGEQVSQLLAGFFR
ncbi:MAG: alpha/beta hydrolase [Acidobacteriaceae bacterium]|nr:alpha/beta hydrolase [Acidobacteriaceae bacterium]